MARFRPNIVLAIGALASQLTFAQTNDDFRQDFETLSRAVASRYAYLDAKATAWADVSRLYADDLQRVTNRREFVAFLEAVVDELYDPHAQLTTNVPTSRRLVPSGADMWAEWRGGNATIVDVRAASDADKAGIAPNDVVISIDSVPIADAVEARLGRSYSHTVAGARDWALRSVLAGRHNQPRLLRIRRGERTREVELAAPDRSPAPGTAPLTMSRVAPGVGYVRFNDSLGDKSCIEAFDRALGELRATRGLIIDLRDTPSGGNTVVARGILGRFVARELPYQKHVLPSEERDTGVRRSWLELVSPRGEFTYSHPVAVLVGHWTGSMGEGLAMGFDATGAGTVVGTAMAGLLGATDHIVLPRSGIGLNLPVEQLFHVNGTPREAFRPKVPVDPAQHGPGDDPYIAAALHLLPN